MFLKNQKLQSCMVFLLLPAALNPRPSRQSVIIHLFKTDSALFLCPAHFSVGPYHQFPKINCVVIQQRQETTLRHGNNSMKLI